MRINITAAHEELRSRFPNARMVSVKVEATTNHGSESLTFQAYLAVEEFSEWSSEKPTFEEAFAELCEKYNKASKASKFIED